MLEDAQNLLEPQWQLRPIADMVTFWEQMSLRRKKHQNNDFWLQKRLHTLTCRQQLLYAKFSVPDWNHRVVSGQGGMEAVGLF